MSPAVMATLRLSVLHQSDVTRTAPPKFVCAVSTTSFQHVDAIARGSVVVQHSQAYRAYIGFSTYAEQASCLRGTR